MLGGGWGWGGGEGAEFWEQLFSVSGLLLQAEPPLISEQQGQTAAAAWGLNVHFLFVVQRTSSKKKKKNPGRTVAFVFCRWTSLKSLQCPGCWMNSKGSAYGTVEMLLSHSVFCLV